MEKKTTIGVMFLALFITILTIPDVSAALQITVNLLENTDQCILKNDIDHCFSKYLICSENFTLNVNDIKFIFRDMEREYLTKSELGNKLDYEFETEKKEDCYEVSITGWKNPYINIDNILCYDDICFYEYAWWNTSMTRYPLITLDNYSNPFLVNDTFGLDIGGGIQYIWCNATSIYIYNDTNGKIYCTNNTDQIGTFIDQGNGTSFGQTEENLSAWLPLDCTGTNCPDLSRYGNDGIAVNTPTEIEGKIGKAQKFNASALEYIIIPYSDPTTTYSWNAWIKYTTGTGEGLISWSNTGSSDVKQCYWESDGTIRCGEYDGVTYQEVVANDMDAHDNEWVMVTFTKNGATAKIYINGIENVSGSVNVATTLNALAIGAVLDLSPGLYSNGEVDNVMIWNRTLSATEITAIYNNTHPDGYSILGDIEAISEVLLTFDSQIPSDITSTNIMNVTANITYIITGEELNISTIRLETVINSSSGISYIFVNGISNPMNRSFNYSFNVSENFTTTLNDNDIYPASYAIEHETMDNSVHTAYLAGNNNQLIKTMLLNVSNSSLFSLFEIMTNSSSGICDIFYCNSSYTIGLVTTSTNCGGFASIQPNTPFNHTHPGTGKSSHIFVPLGLNITSGTVSGVQVTPFSYFIVRGSGCNTFYINNNTATSQTSNNNGNSWTNQTWTVDSHLHQFDDDVFYYRQCANNTIGVKFCSNFSFDNLDVTQLPPSAPFIISPQEGTVRGLINIIYEECISPTGNAIDYYNISLLYPNLTFFTNISDNNSLNLNFIWNSSLVVDDDYRIEVNCVDNLSLNTSAFSGIITIFNNITIEIPNSAIFCFSDSVLFTREVETEIRISGLLIEENTTIIERFINCDNGCSNSTLTNWGNPGCKENPMVLWVALLIAVILLVLLFKGINR